MVRLCPAWHEITTFGQHTRSNDSRRGIPSLPLGSTHGQTMSGVACHHSPWTAHSVERRRVWHAIIALGRQTRSDDVRLDMPSPPLDSIHGRMTSSVALHHHPWTAHTVERRRAWHSIIAFGQHTQSNDVVRGTTSPPLDSTLGRTMSGVA